ncbi:MAG: FAD-dependent monooxygenase, partial [Bacteroidota bacterium]
MLARQCSWRRTALKLESELEQPLGHEQLLTAYQGFHPIVTELLSKTPRQSIHEAKLTDLTGLKTWHRAAVALMGDAAHATTPNLGQGACQAIEDARVLAHYLSRAATVEQAFTQYQTTRQAKVCIPAALTPLFRSIDPSVDNSAYLPH